MTGPRHGAIMDAGLLKFARAENCFESGIALTKMPRKCKKQGGYVTDHRLECVPIDLWRAVF